MLTPMVVVVTETGTITIRPKEKLVKSPASGPEIQTVCDSALNQLFMKCMEE